MTTCKISWIDPQGNFTSDDNPAVGEVYREAYTTTIHGRLVKLEETERFPICEVHARRLSGPGMEHWVFVPCPKEEEELCGP